MDSTHKNSENSVEQNLMPGYTPKSKQMGNIPLSNQIDEALKKKADKTQKDIEKFKTEVIKKIKFVECLGIIPPQASKKIEEEFEISEEESKKGLIHLLVVIPEKQFIMD